MRASPAFLRARRILNIISTVAIVGFVVGQIMIANFAPVLRRNDVVMRNSVATGGLDKRIGVGNVTGTLGGRSFLIISHDLSFTGAPHACVEMAQALGALGAHVSLAVQGQSLLLPSHREALLALISPLKNHDLLFDLVGLTPRVVNDADVVLLSTATAANSAWVVPASPGILAFLFPGISHFLLGTRATSSLDMKPSAHLAWWVHESGAIMDALGPAATRAAVAAMSNSRVNSLVFVSRATQRWWNDQGVLPTRSDGRDSRGHGAINTFPRQNVLLWGIPEWKIRSLSSRMRDIDERLRIRQSHKFAGNDFIFLVVGTFHPMKGHAGILRAFLVANAECPVAHSGGTLGLVAVGGGLAVSDHFPRLFSDSETIEKLDNVRLVPPSLDIASFYLMADAVVSNTQGAGETWGLATLEALSAGKALLASSAGGTLEQVQHNATALLHSNIRAAASFDEVAIGASFFSSNITASRELVEHMCAVATDKFLFDRLRFAGQVHAEENLGEKHINAALLSLWG